MTMALVKPAPGTARNRPEKESGFTLGGAQVANV
jgi:hypothetical protein